MARLWLYLSFVSTAKKYSSWDRRKLAGTDARDSTCLNAVQSAGSKGGRVMAKQLKDYTLEDALRSHDNGFAVVCEDGKPVKLTNNKGGGE